MNQVPDCWVECDGRQIPTGMWAGQKTPDLNNAQRFLRGGTQTEVLETQEDALQQHEHNLYDPGHTHYFTDRYWDRYPDKRTMSSWGTEHHIDWLYDRHDWPHENQLTKNSKSNISVKGVKNGNAATETRPKNMKVVFIMKVC